MNQDSDGTVVGDEKETKLICVPAADHHQDRLGQDHLGDRSDLPRNARLELDAFFEAYRTLEHRGRERTLELVQRMGG